MYSWSTLGTFDIHMTDVCLQKQPNIKQQSRNFHIVEWRCRLYRCSGGSWGLEALGPAILWGPLQGCDTSWDGTVSPRGIQSPVVKAFGQQYRKVAENQGILIVVYTQNSDPISDDKNSELSRLAFFFAPTIPRRLDHTMLY